MTSIWPRGLRRFLLAISAAACLAACGNAPVQPDWLVNSYGALGDFAKAYLAGNSKIADIELARARREIGSTGRPDLLARAGLVRCAERVASLELDDCAATATAGAEVAAPERAYADYLGARWQSLDAARVALLPEQHRSILASRDDGARRATLAAMPDPLARLIAAGALFQQGQLSPAGVEIAVNTASEQGWRRPLLAWLGVQLKLADAAGDAAGKARIQRRIDVALSGAPVNP